MAPSSGRYHRPRSVRQSIHKKAKLRDTVGTVQIKKTLRVAYLNVDGLGSATLEDVRSTVGLKNPDLCVLVETKRRLEELDDDIEIEGYELNEITRSDLANDKDGGGIAFYTKQGDGLLFKPHTPDIDDVTLSFVNKERFWVTVESASSKTAVCGLYLGCQSADDKYGHWNDLIYLVVKLEAAKLRAEGYRVVLIGDFNSHIGNVRGRGIEGNRADINPNGHRFLNFLDDTDSCHVNGLYKVQGQRDTAVTTGLWTRQRGGISTILDYAVISQEHASSVISMTIDDQGRYGGGSDHNWIFLELTDRFAKKKRFVSGQSRKPTWDIKDDQDWTEYQRLIRESLAGIETSSVDALHSSICKTLLDSLTSAIGLRYPSRRSKCRRLPPPLVAALAEKRGHEHVWKSTQTALANTPFPGRTEGQAQEVVRLEKSYLAQVQIVSNLFSQYHSSVRSSILEDCKGNSPRARFNFWGHVSQKKNHSNNITAVLSPTSGVLKCAPDEVKSEVENHLKSVFLGSFDPVPADQPDVPAAAHDHPYSVDGGRRLPSVDNSASLERDPAGWINSDFTDEEISKIVRKLKNGKAKGWDMVPNEAIKYAPAELISYVTLLFNMVKSSGTIPSGWNKGRVTLVHKRGLREMLGNYRPLTVIIAMSGLYSKVLNARLIAVVEEHEVLGEIQNGFRKERCGADNIFVLDTVLWKAKSQRRDVHMGFVDISKAYDSVNRGILWKRLETLGFRGEFLATLKALYSGDSVVCELNGVTTRPVFLQRGLRQGCSLSPMLFAIYIADMGSDLHDTGLGFQLGPMVVSALLFADDIILLARTASGLLDLLSLVYDRCSSLKLVVNAEKSQVVSPTDAEWNIFDDDRAPVLSLKQVAFYRYLGTPTFGSMFRTSLNKQKMCVTTANKYKGSCIYVSRRGPDTAEVALCIWSNVAVPAILTGCEMIPFTETTVAAVERIQAQVAKFILGVPVSTANICAQTELGLKSFRQLLWERQLKFFFRVLCLPMARWVRVALDEHLSGGWYSPYYAYICQLRSELQLFTVPLSQKILMTHISDWFLSQLNSTLGTLSLPCISRVVRLSRAAYVCESAYAGVLAQFKLANAGLGNREPRQGHARKPYCPLCPVPTPTSEFHLAFICPSVSGLRGSTGISSFISSCCLRGVTIVKTYGLFISGKDSQGKDVDLPTYLDRGKCLDDLRSSWLSKW